MIKTQITDSCGLGRAACVNSADGESNALVVATRPLKTNDLKIGFLTNSTYGSDMNKNAAYGGTAVVIANGDSTPWSLTQSDAQWTADSTDRFYAGSKSVKCDEASAGDTATFTNQAGGAGSDITMADYTAFTMWINVETDWIAGDSVLFQGVVDGGLVGNSVDLSDYFDYTNWDVWQSISIPLTDVGLSATNIDAVQFTQGGKSGASTPLFYLDVIQLEETGAPIEYNIKPDKGTWFHIDTVHITMADNVDSEIDTGADTKVPTMYGLSYNKFLGMTAVEGLKFEIYRDDELVTGTSLQVTSLGAILALPDARITNAIADGTNTLISMERKLSVPLILKAEENDELRVTLNDNFSVLLMMKFSVMGYSEDR